MKIPGSPTSIQSFQPQSTGIETRSTRPLDADTVKRFGSPNGLHPQNPQIGPAKGLLETFRDPTALAGRSSDRTEGLNTLKLQIDRQFGSDIASKIFNS